MRGMGGEARRGSAPLLLRSRVSRGFCASTYLAWGEYATIWRAFSLLRLNIDCCNVKSLKLNIYKNFVMFCLDVIVVCRCNVCWFLSLGFFRSYIDAVCVLRACRCMIAFAPCFCSSNLGEEMLCPVCVGCETEILVENSRGHQFYPSNLRPHIKWRSGFNRFCESISVGSIEKCIPFVRRVNVFAHCLYSGSGMHMPSAFYSSFLL
jgi:hypothetical protein